MSVALVGVPNSGKTTLFNWLTGSRFETVNYGGSTVQCHRGMTQARWGQPRLQIVDTPGTYSLVPKSPEEQVTYDTLFSIQSQVSSIVLVLDATQLKRQAHLLAQLLPLGRPVAVALTMRDLLASEGLELDLKKLSQEFGVPIFPVDGRLGGGVDQLFQFLTKNAAFINEGGQVQPGPAELPKWSEQDFVRFESAVNRCLVSKGVSKAAVSQMSRRIDRWALHPGWGSALFLCIMTLLFSSIFWAAEPLMDLIDEGFAAVNDWAKENHSGLWVDFLTDGLLLSVNAVLVFVPQIFILFFGLALLEESGYLARTSTLIDRLFFKLGLSGRSFVPFLSGFACAVPAIMSARNLRSAKERWLTVFVLPLMSCSARLPIYALLLSFLFFGQGSLLPGLVLALIYVGSLLIGGVAALVLSRVVNLPNDSLFAMDLPIYRRPYLKMCGLKAYNKTKVFVKDAGPIIFTFAVIIWGLSAFPRIGPEAEAPALAESYLGRGGKYLEPVFAPMGADWKTGVGILASFAAREIFVSSMAIVMNVDGAEEQDDESLRASLLAQMQGAVTDQGEPVFTLASVVALIVFFMIALQCMSTVAMTAREMRSARFAAVQWVSLTSMAYLLAVVTFQILK